MTDRVSIETIPNVPFVEAGHDIGDILVNALLEASIVLEENDVICIASKAISMAEGRVVLLNEVEMSKAAQEIHSKVPRKDPRTIQLMINETGDPEGSRIVLTGNHLAGWLPNGLRLTSAGVDKIDAESVILLPKDPDASAKAIGNKILSATNVNVGIVITDSDGREDKKGSTQLAIGVYGVPPLRKTTTAIATSEETLCDMLAASAALIMGQRGTNKPAVLIRGVDYTFDPNAKITEALN